MTEIWERDAQSPDEVIRDKEFIELASNSIFNLLFLDQKFLSYSTLSNN